MAKPKIPMQFPVTLTRQQFEAAVYFSLADAAVRISSDYKRLVSMIEAGNAPPVVMYAGKPFIGQADLISWLQSKERTQQHEPGSVTRVQQVSQKAPLRGTQARILI